MTKVPFFELRKQFQSLRDEILQELTEVCDAQSFILGPKVQTLEQALSEVVGSTHAVGTSSGTDAQLLIMMAMGIGRGDAVVTTPFTFFSTAGCISRLGARPMFVDVDSATFNLDPSRLADYFEKRCLQREKGLQTSDGLRIRAVVPVHLFGLCCAMDEISEVCSRFGVPIIEDAAQAIGAEYPSAKGVKRAGSMGLAAYFSFYPTKNLGAFGDAGLAATSEADLGEKLRIFRDHGMRPRYFHEYIGGNFRLDAIQAAVLLKKLPHLERWSRRRWEIAQRYKALLSGVSEQLRLPVEPFAAELGSKGHIYHQFVVRTAKRDLLRKFLTEHGIGTEIYYPMALHQQKCFADLNYESGSFPEAERAAAECLALPVFPELLDEQIQSVAATIREFFNE